jgi:HD superfamily phosphodiesterase
MDIAKVTDYTVLEKAEKFVRDVFANEIPYSSYTYHSIDHTMQVQNAAIEIAGLAGLSAQDKEILGLATLFHDVGFAEVYQGHEEVSKKYAKEFLVSENYPEEYLQQVLDCIDATKVTHQPAGILEWIMKDADMCSLGKRTYFEQAEKLRLELNDIKNENLSVDQWKEINLEFLENHKYHTDEAKLLFRERKMKNIQRLQKDLGKGGQKPKKIMTIATSKSAQTQFKTSLRNHIDLSSIADNKANIMLSVNALIITFSIPNLDATQILFVPLVILVAVSVTSIVFATLATRPIKMKGKTNEKDIQKKNSNLFFFGNFYNMSFSEYTSGIETVVGDEENLSSSITRDLFYLGKSLGKKYYFLRLCYNIFMFGIIFAVAVAAVMLLFQDVIDLF